MTRKSCKIYATGIVCAHLLILGIALHVAQVFQTMIHNRLKKELTLTPDSRVLDSWINPPPPVYMQYYFFNVTNPDVILAGGKPSVTQIGPYTYRCAHASASPARSSGHFHSDMSYGPGAVMSELNSYNFFLRTVVSMWMTSQGLDLFMTRTVEEILWGFKDPLMTKLHTLKPEVDEYFGLMYKKNGTHEGEFVFHTGEQDYMDYGKIDTWNGLRHMSWWSSNQSNMINGTDGSVFHTFLSRDELLYIFAADLCRSIHLAYVNDEEVKGIPALRFAPPSDVLESPDANPANAGFCVPAGDCLGKGVLKVSVCREGAPIVVSFPHFYQADEKYINAIEGMSPNKEEHETYLDLNPTTGLPIRACKRAQLNIILKRVAGFPKTKFLNETIFPIMYVNETATIDDGSASQMRTLLVIVTVVSNFPIIILAMGVILLFVLLFLLCRSSQRKNEVNRIDFTEAFHSFATTKDETAYTQVSDKADDSAENRSSQPMRNGSYIAMSPVEAQKC
uniref:Uncharacterized protein n=1 Tax=Denticeps clupeoides TaxID=299321 RepID=A0AAY4C3I3_9TELE